MDCIYPDSLCIGEGVIWNNILARVALSDSIMLSNYKITWISSVGKYLIQDHFDCVMSAL